MSVCPSVRMQQLGSHWTEFYGILYLRFFSPEIPSRKSKFHSSLLKLTGSLHEDLCTFVIISSSVPLRMRNVSDKICRENQKNYFTYIHFFPFENRAFYEIK